MWNSKSCRRLCGIQRTVGDWQYEFDYAERILKKKCFSSVILGLALCGVIYSVWKERDVGIFNGKSSQATVVDAQIVQLIQFRLCNTSFLHEA